jgi:hypothetical protein
VAASGLRLLLVREQLLSCPRQPVREQARIASVDRLANDQGAVSGRDMIGESYRALDKNRGEVPLGVRVGRVGPNADEGVKVAVRG